MIRSESGMTLIEVSAGLIVLGIMVTMLNSYSLLQQISSLKQEKQSALQEVIIQNVAELHGKGIGSFPNKTTPVTTGNCFARYYTAQGAYLREAQGTLSSATCTSAYSADAGEIKVLLRLRPSLSGSTSFTPAQFLKLPSYSNSLVEIEILGSYQPPKGSPSPPLSLTIVKRI